VIPEYEFLTVETSEPLIKAENRPKIWWNVPTAKEILIDPAPKF
jgi:hypothetical protein